MYFNYKKTCLGSLITYIFLLLAGCSFSDEVQFNEDFSGSVSYEADITEFMQIMEEMGQENENVTTKQMQTIEEIVDSVNQIGGFDDNNDLKGISNFKVSGEGNVMTVTFDFEDLEALNLVYEEGNVSKAMGFTNGEAAEEGDFPGPKISFAMEGDAFVYTLEKPEQPDENEDPSMGEMETMIQFNTTLSFAKTVKDVEAENSKFAWMDNTVVISYTLDDMMTILGNPKVKVIFK